MPKLVALMIVGALAVWGCTMAVHMARAEDAPAGPRWKIVLTLEDPDEGPMKLTYGSKAEGPHWFVTQEACEVARNGGEKKLAEGLAQLRESIKRSHSKAVVSTACVSDGNTI